MTNVIVTTTINPPTKAVRLFDALPDWHLVVLGDLKTPEDYHLERGTYLGPAEQEKIDKTLSDLIGWNCIQRRNFGFLVAREMGAEVVAVVDDDNVPYEGWGRDLLVGRDVEVEFFATSLPAFDPVGATNYPHLWHRGYPLQLLPQRDYSTRRREVLRPDVQADFWNGDPDIDAICRMQFAPDCSFDESLFPMAADAMSPFNSQNTFLGASWLQHYFLFPDVGRMDDIWAAYYLQGMGAKVAFAKPSVVQERNPHDLVVDMKKEYLGYEHNLAIVEAVAGDPDALFRFLPAQTVAAFERYRTHF
ncbi:MAG: hypothetical protein CYG61_03135 [Actinobacteria bacterium]|nr:MAG: hypothetical protein CYG61_03135 [Actinomycetota bacterium]